MPRTTKRRTTPSAASSRLKSLRVSDAFRDYALEQLAGVRHVHARAMFGGIGLYSDAVFFGILAADALYLKVDASTVGPYVAAGMPPFTPYADRPTTMSYRQVPVAVLEDADELRVWAGRAIRVAGGVRTG